MRRKGASQRVSCAQGEDVKRTIRQRRTVALPGVSWLDSRTDTLLPSQERQMVASEPSTACLLPDLWLVCHRARRESIGGPTLHFASFVLWMPCRGLRFPSSVSLSMAGRVGGGGCCTTGAFQYPDSVSLPIQGRAVRNRATQRCLEIKKDTSGYFVPVLQTCTTQGWTIQHTVRDWGAN